MALNRMELCHDIQGLEEIDISDTKNSFRVVFPGAAATAATQGSVLENTALASIPPTITFADAVPGKKYCCIMTDPDAISRSKPIFREFIHWVIADIDFFAAAAAAPAADDDDDDNSASAGTVTAGKEVLPYVGPGPPCNSGLHRYAFLLYEQPEGADLAALAAAFDGRGGKKAHVSAVAAGLGSIVSMDWFQCEWDENVDQIHETLGFIPSEEYQSPKQKAAAAAVA